ncbi:YidB family protein [Erwinia oleae]|uniref:YidB family protein n=1 Tax=Erwinia oleae TaxID=796334 RepID=UPI00054E9BFF|nr:YidB family protein [Erwinia oleae]
MGILDNVLGHLSGDANGGSPGHVEAVWEWIQEQGGIEALYQRFQQGGMLAVVTSWIGHSASKSLSGHDVQAIFGESALSSLAVKLGMDVPGASGILATYLPSVVGMLSSFGKAEGHMTLPEGLDPGSLLTTFLKR